MTKTSTHRNSLTNSKGDISESRKRGSLVSSLDAQHEEDALRSSGRQHKKTKLTTPDETSRTAIISADDGKIGDLKNRYDAEDDFPLTSYLRPNEERNFPPDGFLPVILRLKYS
jgi:hypothetical protein